MYVVLLCFWRNKHFVLLWKYFPSFSNVLPWQYAANSNILCLQCPTSCRARCNVLCDGVLSRTCRVTIPTVVRGHRSVAFRLIQQHLPLYEGLVSNYRILDSTEQMTKRRACNSKKTQMQSSEINNSIPPSAYLREIIHKQGNPFHHIKTKHSQ